MKSQSVKIGTRGSNLALYQANKVKEELEILFPGLNFEIVIIKTKGDKILDVALSKIGDKGLFTKELETALFDKTIDMAVHSVKDMPTDLPKGLMLGAVLKRGEINDALVSFTKNSLDEITPGDRVATSSLRRIAGLLNIDKKFTIVDIRGNVNTRLQKMKDGYCDAMIMAATGLRRLGMEEYIRQVISPDLMIPAVGQGAISIEVRQNDDKVNEWMQKVNHQPTWKAISAERAFMHTLQGGCQVPVGCYSIIEDKNITLKGFVASLDGEQYIREQLTGLTENAEETGKELANIILAKGGDKILSGIRKL